MRRSRRGITLVEQVMALTILAIGLLAVSAAGDTLHRGGRHAVRRSQVIAAAAAQREQLVAASCRAPAVGAAEHDGIRLAWHSEPLGAARVHVVRAEDAVPSGAVPARLAAHETVGASWCTAR